MTLVRNSRRSPSCLLMTALLIKLVTIEMLSYNATLTEFSSPNTSLVLLRRDGRVVKRRNFETFDKCRVGSVIISSYILGICTLVQ